MPETATISTLLREAADRLADAADEIDRLSRLGIQLAEQLEETRNGDQDPATDAQGRDLAGLPGNCLQAAVASLLELDLDQVPHFAVYVDWFAAMRRWARERDGDFTYFPFPVPEEHATAWERTQEWGREHNAHVILGGSSPRGPFGHVVIGTVDLEVTHDPHPSRAGLVEVEDAIVYCNPYDPPPITLALQRGAA